ncbi:MAG: GNAT family N-acetyltransferase [Candidatus Zipacnadales bacterium]
MSYYTGAPIRRGPIEIRNPDVPGFRAAREAADVDVSDWFERAASSPNMLYFALVLAADGTPIGEVVLHDIDRDEKRACIHAHLFRQESRQHRHGEHALKAVVEYAFGHEKLEELRLVLAEGNFPARRCYAKCGFQQLDRLDEDDSQIVMRLTRNEWRRMVKEQEW